MLVLVLVLVERLFKPGFSVLFGNQPKTARLAFFGAKPAEPAEPAFEAVLDTRTWFSEPLPLVLVSFRWFAERGRSDQVQIGAQF